MNQEFVRNPTIKGYEASRDGVVRICRLKKPVGNVSNSGYLMFKAGGGGKMYYNHRFIYECFFGEIKIGLVIDHKNSVKLNNNISNLQAITPSENNIRGNVGKCRIFGKRAVKSVNIKTGTERIFQSMNAAGRYFGIHPDSVQKVAEKVTKSALTKKSNQRISFCYISLVPDTEDTSFRDV